MIKLLPPGLHVVLGDSAGGIFTRVFFARDRLLIDQDVLSCGPTPPCTDLAAWRKLRADYWSSFVPGHVAEHVHSRFNLVDNAKRLIDAERIHIWAATGVSEQLFIAFVVHLTQLVGADLSKLAIVPFESVGKRRVKGLGELDEEQMRAHAEPMAIPAEIAQQYLGAWSAITSANPAVLVGFAVQHSQASSWLKLAMRLMTRRYPDKRTGLSYWDHALLSPREGARTGGLAHHRLHHGRHVRVRRSRRRLVSVRAHAALGSERNPQPLLTLSGELTSIRSAEAVLTPFGEEVLAGTASNYPANPIDDWAGGVRLSSEEGALWFNDGGRLVRG